MNALAKLPLILVLCTVFICSGASAAQTMTLSAKITFGKADALPKDKTSGLVAAVLLTLPKEYHAYSHETVDTGRPTELDMRVGGVPVTSVLYPRGAAQRDIFSPENSVFVYEGDVYLFAHLPPDAQGKPYTAQVSLLLCSKRNCVPINQDITGVVPHKIPRLDGQPWHEQYQQTLAETKGQNPPPELTIPVVRKPKEPLPKPELFAEDLHPVYASGFLEITTLSKAILFGILAGLLLNIMPCVLPVLTFKISGLLLVGRMDQEERIRRFRMHNLFFSAGIISFFSVLASILGLADMIWGELFQNETLILVMIVLVFAMSLSLLGVFTLPVIDLKVGTRAKNPHIQAYLTGFLTTLLATPCSGPLLGGVLGWAFTQPFMILMVIFWSIGIGMALPYCIFSLYPNAVLLLPKAGSWMTIVEDVAGFFLMGTTIYLISILPEEKFIQVLSVLLLVSVSCWIWGKYCGADAPKLRRRVFAVIGTAILLFSFHWVVQPVPPPFAWQTFTPQMFTEQLGKKMLFIEFTADWCPNCKVLEKTVLTDTTLKNLQNRANCTFIKADLTQANAAATYLLTELGSHSIPLTAIFPKGSNARSPIVIRDVYTKDMLLRSYDTAVQKSN